MPNAAQKLLSTFDTARANELFRELLAAAGVTVNGPEPWDIQVHDERFFARILRDGSVGLGESFVEGWWDCAALDQMSDRVLRARLDKVIRESWVLVAHVLRARLFNMQALARAFEVGERHYDLGNQLYEAMLDPRMVYTCAYWKDARTLAEAQEAKLDLVCRKLDLQPGMRVLELGCGWGSFAGFAAEKYGVEVVGYTVSKAQAEWARARYAGLPIELRLEDYRGATGAFDRVVSIGLMEHVGPKNYRGYMELVERTLAPDGVAFVHTIGGNRARGQIDPWYHKYIFPNAVLPTLGQLTSAMDEVLITEDVQNIGPHYDPTLMAWFANFDAAWPQLRGGRLDDKFYRMWKYYLLTSAAGFRARYLQLYQLVMTRIGSPQPTRTS